MTTKLTDTQKQQIESLKVDDVKKLKASLTGMAKNGSVELFPALMDLYQSNSDQEIRELILGLIMDVKNKKAPEIIAAELNARKWEGELSALLSAIWQSGLDYGLYIGTFVKFVENADLNVCMEALTCIEEFFYNESVEDRNMVRQQLKEVALNVKGTQRDMLMIYLENLR